MAAQPEYSAGSTHYLFPADFATIYDLNPLYSAGTTGTGRAIAIAGRSNINLSDVASFRSMAGLAANTPSVIVDGTDPGLVSGDQSESTLDVEWSGAVAPEAAVTLVVAASTATTDGVDLASAYIVNHATAPVVSVSYGSCEREMGTTELGFLQQPVGAGGERGNERVCRLGRRGRGRMPGGQCHDGIGARGEWAVQFALCHMRGRNGVQRGRECRAVLVRDELFGVWLGAELHSRGSVERERA